MKSYIKSLLGLPPNAKDSDVTAEWDRRTKAVCKPCWELKYCPYGPLVEDFPILPLLRKDAIEHNQYLKNCLESGRLPDGTTLDEERTRVFQEEVSKFNPEEYPEKYSKVEFDWACNVSGHLCPVFFVNEPLTETNNIRRVGRSIPFHTKMRVARRDNYTCQECGVSLKDNEIEFDHIIPISKGGSSEEHNIRVTCFECNRSKGNKMG